MDRVECADCMSEALMTVGIYDNRKVPKDLVKRVEQAYDDEVYHNHELDSKPVRV